MAWIFDNQLSLLGSPTPIGFGNNTFAVKIIEREKANEIIRKNHYSKKIYSASTEHFGVFVDNELCGVLQWGFAMNPQSMASVVSDTALNEYLELNRMWLDDACPRFSESRAISYSLRLIQRLRPKVAWVQSFADERCGGLGVVYQACSFLYCGEHLATFWELNGVWYHNSLMTRNPQLSRSAAYLQSNKHNAIAHQLRQFRYIKFLRKSYRNKLLLPVMPYPKREHDNREMARLLTMGMGV